ncbi:MAG: tetratricopeptide repeat protein [Isosphaeraceae bacterium]
MLQEPEQAFFNYQQLLEKEPDDALAIKRMAAVLISQNRYSAISSLGERLMALPGEEVAGRTLSGIGHHVARRYAQAEEDFERVLAIDPGLKSMPLPATLFWNHLAIDLLAQGKGDEAKDYLLHALEQTEDAGLRELLGLCYNQVGRPDDAERCWREAVRTNPGELNAWLDLGRLALARGRIAEAVDLLSNAARLGPNSLEANYSLAQALRLQGKAAEAASFEARATALRTEKPQAGGMGEMPGQPRAPEDALPRPLR